MDIIALYYSFILAYYLRFSMNIFPAVRGIPAIEQYQRAMPVVILVFIGVFNWAGLYDSHKMVYKTDEFIGTLRSVLVGILLIIAGTFLYREYSYSRLVIIYATILAVILVYSSHLLGRYLRSKLLYGGGKMGVLIVGGNKSRERLKKNIGRSGRFYVRHIPDFDLTKIASIMKDGSIGDVVLTDPDAEREKILELINLCEDNEIDFKMVPDMIELKMGEMRFDSYFGMPVMSLKHPLLEPSNYYFKRISDIIASMTILVIASPFLIFLFILIKIDSPGPVFYSHLRKGFKGREFPFYKLRSMVTDADAQLKNLMKYNERSGAAFKMKCDPRVTRVGNFIRKYSIDEIPQLFNVLKGDMSLVGPRPQVLWEASFYDDEAKRRLNILPGVTGLWQVSGRSDLSYEEMIRLDLYYLENWTPGLDLKILIKTVGVVALKKGAC